jgi:hypothetical protein
MKAKKKPSRIRIVGIVTNLRTRRISHIQIDEASADQSPCFYVSQGRIELSKSYPFRKATKIARYIAEQCERRGPSIVDCTRRK